MSRKHPHPVEVVKSEYGKPETVRSFASRPIWPAEAMLVERYVPADARVLDLACGAGRTAIPLARQGLQVTGIDFLPPMIEAATQKAQQADLPVDCAVMDVTDMAYPDGLFDAAVFFYNAFELIWGKQNRIAVLNEVHRVLRPGGVFILTSRSGLSFGKRWLAWPWLIIRTCLLKPLHLANPYLELQDVYSRGTYHRYQTPFTITRDLGRVGFDLVLFNSRANLEAGKPATILTNFSSDMCLFFVARKP